MKNLNDIKNGLNEERKKIVMELEFESIVRKSLENKDDIVFLDEEWLDLMNSKENREMLKEILTEGG